MRLWVHAETFAQGTNRDRAKKVAEEGTEAYGAYEGLMRLKLVEGEGRPDAVEGAAHHVLYECCDTIQAALNMVAGMGFTQAQLDACMEEVRKRNEERGRYR